MAKAGTSNTQFIRDRHESPVQRNFLSVFSRTRKAPPKRNPTAQLEHDSFVGMWRDRQDFEDSSAWVRSVREREWVKHSG